MTETKRLTLATIDGLLDYLNRQRERIVACNERPDQEIDFTYNECLCDLKFDGDRYRLWQDTFGIENVVQTHEPRQMVQELAHLFKERAYMDMCDRLKEQGLI